MKKNKALSFVAVLMIGLLSGCGSIGKTGIEKTGGIQGSGNAKTETRKVSGFKEIKAVGAVNIEITSQKDFGLTIEADDNLLEHIKTETSGSTLTIGTKDSISPKTKINIKISLPELTNLELSGATIANVSAVKSDSLKLNANGASKIIIDGEVKFVDAIANGASNVDAEKLKTENAKVNSSGASSITVSATGDLDADASGASTVIYTNEPKNLKQNSSGASTIKKK